MQDLMSTTNASNQSAITNQPLSPLFSNSSWTTQKYGPDLYAASLSLAGLSSVDGTPNNDVLRSLGGSKVLGFGAQDELFGGAGGDWLDAGEGDDRVFGDAGKDWLLGRGGQDQLWGGLGGDYLDGGDGDDRLYGEAGRDWLLGGDGQDQLFGGDGTDILNGNQGDNRLTGGAGSDVFVIGRSGKSWVEDFQVGVDVLALDGLTFEQLRIFNQNGEAWITTLDNQPVAFLKGVDAGLLSVKDFADLSITAVLGNVEADWAKAFEDYTKNGGFGNGAFVVGQSGQVSIDYLFDGSGYEGQLAIFSLTGMEGFLQGDPDAFMQEAARRALSSSGLGHTVIFDAVEGARFSGEVGYEGNFNAGQYLGAKSFSMKAGEKFAVMLVPNGKVEDVAARGLGFGDGSSPMFSIASLNLGRSSQFAQVIEATAADKSFAFEDTGLWGNSDRDFNDVVFQMKGAVGSSLPFESTVAPGKDWRSSQVGQQVEQFTVEPVDLAGNTIATARNSTISTAGKNYRGWVGRIDTDDFYSFSLGTLNQFKLNLDGLTSDANVELLDITGKVIASSKNSGTASEVINIMLETGAYRVRVNSTEDNSTAFNLRLSVIPMIEGVEGITTSGSDAPMYTATDISTRLIRVDGFRSGSTLQGSRTEFSQINGGGYTAAILDTGIDLDHPFFGLDNDGNGIADRILFNFDFANNRGINRGNDLDGHGSNVSSILASQDATFPGVAPSAGIIHLRVFRDDGVGVWGATEQALQWLLGTDPGERIPRISKYNIFAVNLSIQDQNNYSANTSLYGLDDELKALADRGVIVVGAAGNFFPAAQGVTYPAADPNVLAVSSVWDGGTWWDINGTPGNFTDDVLRNSNADQITNTSQRSSTLTDIFAPGAMIVGAGADGNPELRVNNTNVQAAVNGTREMGGTSMAAPHITGMALLAQQLARQELGRPLSIREFRDLLYNSGVPIADPITGVTTFRRADMLGLATAIMNLRPPNNRNINLSTSQLNIAQPSFSTGDNVTVEFQIKNTGLDSAGAFNVGFYLSEDLLINEQDVFLNSFTVNSLAASSNTALLSHNFNLPASNDPVWRSFLGGSGYIGIIVDGRDNQGNGANSIGETNETDNRNLGLSIDSDSIQVLQRRRLIVSGNIYGVDDEAWPFPDEIGTAAETRQTDITQPDSSEVLKMDLRWGGETRVELDITGQVTDLAGNIQVQGTAKFFEGTSEDTTNLRGEVPFSRLIPRGQTFSETFRVNNTVNEGDGYADISLGFDNTDGIQLT